MPWESVNNLSKDQKEEHAKRVAETNKAWGEKNERERRERVAKSFESEKTNKQSTSKGPKM